MAWLATDNAESYANGNNIDGLNGGTDWSAAWTVAGSGTKDIINTPTLEGGLCFRLQGTALAEAEALRTFANTTSGSISFIARRDSATADQMRFVFRESGAFKFNFGMYGNDDLGFGTGHFAAVGSANTDLGTFAADTNYTIVIEYDNSTDQFRVSVNGGSTFSAWLNYSAVATNLNDLRFAEGNSSVPSVTRNTYFDDIKAFTAAAAVSVPPNLLLMGVG